MKKMRKIGKVMRRQAFLKLVLVIVILTGTVLASSALFRLRSKTFSSGECAKYEQVKKSSPFNRYSNEVFVY